MQLILEGIKTNKTETLTTQCITHNYNARQYLFTKIQNSEIVKQHDLKKATNNIKHLFTSALQAKRNPSQTHFLAI